MNEFVVKDDNKLTVGIGWDAKKVDLKKKIKIAIDSIMSATSEDTYDLNLAAIVEHNDGSDPELVFWGHKYSRRVEQMQPEIRSQERSQLHTMQRIRLQRKKL